MRLNPYPKYKTSDVEWLGDVPEHWEVKRVKDIATIINGYPFDSLRFDPYIGIPLVRIRDISGGITEAFWNGEAIAEAEIKDGDILVGMDGDFNATLWNSGYALLNQRVCCLRTESNDAQKILFYMLPIPLKIINCLTYLTTVKHLSSIDLGKVRISSPPPNEQSSIAAFLDRETAKIDTLITKQEKLIQLLMEKRQSVISYAVTKGLNPNVKMKNSGVEWLGNIPEHWFVVPLGRILFDADSVFIDGDWIESKDISEEGFRYLTSGNIGEGVFKEQGQAFISETTFAELNCTEVLSGDVLISRLNLPIGRACIAPNLDCRMVTCVDNVIVRPNQSVDRQFLVYMLTSKEHFANMETLARGTTMQRISRSTLSHVRFAFPTKSEQSSIAAFLDRETGKIDALIAKAEQAIALQKEHRTALISAAVTGKIDVREAA